MLRSPALTQRSLAVFVAVALLAVAGQVLVQRGLSQQEAAYLAYGALARVRVLTGQLVRGAALDARGTPGAGHDVADARARLDRMHALLVGAARPASDEERTVQPAIRAGAGDSAAALAAVLRRLVDATVRAPDGTVGPLLAAEHDLTALTDERRRVVLADVRDALARTRHVERAIGALLLLTLGAGWLVVVRPAIRASDRLLGELLDSRARTEDATRAATRGREFAASLVAASPDAVYAFDAGERVTEWNPAMERWTGVPRAQALGRGAGGVVAELDWGEAGRPYARALVGESTRVHQLAGRARAADATGWFDVSCDPLRAADGRVTGGVVMIRDVGERVAALERVRAGEARFRALFDQAPLGIFLVDAAGAIRDVNPAFARLVGRPAAELRGVRVAALSPPGDTPVETTAEHRALTGAAAADGAQGGSAPPVHVERRFVRATGEPVWVELTIAHLTAPEGGATTLGMAQDITARKTLEARLAHQAYHDPLTALANRARLREAVDAALARAADAGRAGAPHVALLYVDLDDFKRVNDALGHAAGDRVLVQVAERLRAATRGGDTVARLGGDEFAVLLERVRDAAEVRAVAERVGEALRAPHDLDGGRTVVGASVGVAFLDGAASTDALLRDADAAMYAAKRAGKGRHAVFG